METFKEVFVTMPKAGKIIFAIILIGLISCVILTVC